VRHLERRLRTSTGTKGSLGRQRLGLAQGRGKRGKSQEQGRTRSFWSPWPMSTVWSQHTVSMAACAWRNVKRTACTTHDTDMTQWDHQPRSSNDLCQPSSVK
jgi:hypothetical protein